MKATIVKTKSDPYHGQWFTYSIFNLHLASDFPFANRLAKSDQPASVTFTCVTEAPVDNSWQKLSPSFASFTLIDSGKSFLYIYRHDDYDLLCFSEVAHFYLWSDRIICHLIDPAYDYMIEIHFLGIVLSFWLERQGILALHASSVVIKNRAAAFLATNKGGKSSLAASLMQIGYPLLTDDILPLKSQENLVEGSQGYPQMRMWPDQAEHFLGYYEQLELVHPRLSKRRIPVGTEGIGYFCNQPQPLCCFYVPERRDPLQWGTDIEIVPLPFSQAVIELVRNSFIPHIVEAMDWNAQRFLTLTQILQKVPVRRLIYPSGMEHIPRVRESIIADIHS